MSRLSKLPPYLIQALELRVCLVFGLSNVQRRARKFHLYCHRLTLVVNAPLAQPQNPFAAFLNGNPQHQPTDQPNEGAERTVQPFLFKFHLPQSENPSNNDLRSFVSKIDSFSPDTAISETLKRSLNSYPAAFQFKLDKLEKQYEDFFT